MHAYKNPDNDPRGSGHQTTYFVAKPRLSGDSITITTPPGGNSIYRRKDQAGDFRRRFAELARQPHLVWRNRQKHAALKRFLTKLQDGSCPPSTWWLHDEVGHNGGSEKGNYRAISRCRRNLCYPKTRKIDSANSKLRSNPKATGFSTRSPVPARRGCRSQDGSAMDHGGTRRALPHAHHSAAEESHRRRQIPAALPSRRLERRRRIPLLPARAVAAGEGPVRQLGHQQGIQRGDAGRGDVQA